MTPGFYTNIVGLVFSATNLAMGPFDGRRRRFLWLGLLVGMILVVGLALSPPFLPLDLRAVVWHGFSPVCHQLPSRSPHVGGIPIAICDRCSGIYMGLLLGVAIAPLSRRLWNRLGRWSRYLFLGAVGPLALDWVGPLVGAWQNVPMSRAATGFLFGAIAASFITDQLLRRATQAPRVKRSETSY